MDIDEAARKIREAAENGKIEIAESDGVDSFPFADEFILEVLGHDCAFISDMSDLSDFDAKDEETYAKIEAKYGVDVRGTNNLLAIFRVIAAAQNHA